MPIAKSKQLILIGVVLTLVLGTFGALKFAPTNKCNTDSSLQLKIEEQLRIARASAPAVRDFRRAVIGEHVACKANPDVVLSDGGTQTFKCSGYEITVLSTMTSVYGIPGLLYGPILKTSTGQIVTDIRFYRDGDTPIDRRNRAHR